jgi:hypothetical protein
MGEQVGTAVNESIFKPQSEVMKCLLQKKGNPPQRQRSLIDPGTRIKEEIE